MKQLRETDSQFNKDNWPNLCYEQRCLLYGGYKRFYEEYPEHCTQNGGYISMFDDQFDTELAQEREQESKSWEKKPLGPAQKKPSLNIFKKKNNPNQ
mmetsp:Transcript_10925/g.9419  ORF Transcript_10925/g.9419 Transcript_10925/m.9419 type:complete len:97 (-) Transcript_10925:32-322(-)